MPLKDFTLDHTSDYASGLKDVLIRKINKTEQSLYGLKLDYCRFVFGLSHRSKVTYDEVVYQVRSVDLDSMIRKDDGEWTKPNVTAVRHSQNQGVLRSEPVDLGQHWEIYTG